MDTQQLARKGLTGHKNTVSGSCTGYWLRESAHLALFFWEATRKSSRG